MSTGVIREWNGDEGWGVIDSTETPGGCWAHFSAAAVDGYVSFGSGERVDFEWEAPGQDGFPFRALKLWPSGSSPVARPSSSGGAYSSTLSLHFDEQP
ncbi:cold shock domain-containing protein [Actinoplanes sp. NPDC049596]|uniref:cold shock domain-containing protein n=1 Tax=unclassified Actinoplanes TaxID=2626549 RepID=UPI00342B3B74